MAENFLSWKTKMLSQKKQDLETYKNLNLDESTSNIKLIKAEHSIGLARASALCNLISLTFIKIPQRYSKLTCKVVELKNQTKSIPRKFEKGQSFQLMFTCDCESRVDGTTKRKSCENLFFALAA